jgi:hypothetical protein
VDNVGSESVEPFSRIITKILSVKSIAAFRILFFENGKELIKGKKNIYIKSLRPRFRKIIWTFIMNK